MSPLVVVVTLAFGIPAGRADVGSAGTVVYATASLGYVDAGSDHGVTAGQELKIVRRKKPIGSCVVVEVAAHKLACKSDRIIVGDALALPAAVASTKQAPTKNERRPDAPLSEFEMESVRDLVDSAPIEKVAAKKGAIALPLSTHGTATLRQQVWAISTAPGGFVRSSIDLGVSSLLPTPLGNVIGSAAARVSGDLFSPPTKRNRPKEPVDVYVWNASVALDGPVAAEIGRFRPRMAPGSSLLDGVQGGVRVGPAEIGVYGGTIPDLITIYPTLAALTGGAYFGIDLDTGFGVLVLPRLRAGLVSSPDFAHVRAELDATTEIVWNGVMTVGAGARLDSVKQILGAPSLDDVELEADVTGLAPLRLSADYRYQSGPFVDFDGVVDGLDPEPPAHHASLNASYPLLDGALDLGGVVGGGYDVLTKGTRAYVGPEVGLPNAFGAFGGLDAGLLAELGAFAGRSGYLGARIAPVSTLQLSTRLSYFDADALGEPYREVGLMNIVDAPVLPWLSIRGSVFVQQAIPPARGAVRATPTLVYGDVGVTGSI